MGGITWAKAGQMIIECVFSFKGRDVELGLTAGNIHMDAFVFIHPQLARGTRPRFDPGHEQGPSHVSHTRFALKYSHIAFAAVSRYQIEGGE